ncbi:MAG: hypothetical protein CL678_05270 [Bdellovibrionaceae bacterium]|nr:hypothetical protein [Pseudobdellovibrionaceae bacterium]|tara:strand:+ start:1192 stop:3699 length:2508 start_codon:yes stop_codon:yes gene_type:complete
MRNIYKRFTFFVILFLCGCGEQGKQRSSTHIQIQPSPIVKAEQRIGQSFGVDEGIIFIRESALNKEFLLSSSEIPQVGAPTSSGLSSRVVAFSLARKDLVLLEATHGHVVTDSLDSSLILARFPLIKKVDDKIFFDFNAGMKFVPQKKSWYLSDREGQDYDFSSDEEAFPIIQSFLSSIKKKGNFLEIRQNATLKISEDTQKKSEIRYFLSPYLPEKDFIPIEQPNGTDRFLKIGYFEVSPFLKKYSGESITHISRWNLSHDRKIIFYLSANTPVEYRSSIKEGLLYWNRAFEREVIEVRIAPEKIDGQRVGAPDPQMNIVQWVEWDRAGSAYADVLPDPRSGQILHAQIYLTSTFAFGGRERVRKLLRQMSTPLENKFSISDSLCDHDMRKHIKSYFHELLSSEVSDETLLRISQDYVRSTAAHEMGHILGLRHNFAGSLAESKSSQERLVAFKEYLTKAKVPSPKEHLLTSSVMDYLSFDSDSMSGGQIKQYDDIFSYDQQAVLWGYQRDQWKPQKTPLYCVDSQVSEYMDCNRNDAGSNIVESAALRFKRSFESLHQKLAERMISVISNPKKNLNDLSIDIEDDVDQVLSPVEDWLLRMKASEKSLQVERSFRYPQWHQDTMRDKQFDLAQKQFSAVGGIAQLLKGALLGDLSIAEEAMSNFVNHFNTYLDLPFVKKGRGPENKPYELSLDEMNQMSDLAYQYVVSFKKHYWKKLLTLLNETRLEAPFALEELEELYFDQAQKFVFEFDQKNGKFLKYRYPYEVRSLALSLLSEKMAIWNDWGLIPRLEMKKKLKEQLKGILGKDFELDPSQIQSRKIRQFLIREKSLLETL